MHYPTLDQVEAADRLTLARWFRLLPSPRPRPIHVDEAAYDCEAMVMNRIVERFKEAGGMTPGISKTIGWGE